MTDLGHLLSSVEENVERAHTGSVVPAGVLDGARSTVRRRRTVRHARDGALSVVALVAVGGVVTWGLQPGPTSTGVATTSGPTTSGPTPEATPAPTSAGEQLSLGAPVPAATPREVPIADLLTSTGPGWSLAIVSQVRLDAPAVMRPGDMRDVVTLVSPSGERTALLDVGERTMLYLAAWRPGSTTAVASVAVGDGAFQSGLIDLLDGTLTPLPFEWEHHPLGLTATGESAWLDVPMPADVREAVEADPGHASPVAPGALVALDPDPSFGPPATSGPTGRLRLVAPDGVVRDGGDVTLPLRLHPLSPDGEWLVGQGSDQGLVGVDLRTGEQHPVADAPDDPACRLVGWADDHAVLTACPAAAGAWHLDAVDVAGDGGATRLATSDVPVRDAWPLGDGRVGLGRVVMPAPCDVTSDPAVLADGTVRSLTDGWSPHDHGTSLSFTGGAVWTHVNGCYPGSGRADPQRDVRVDLATGETTTLAWLDDRRDAAHVVVDEDVWLVTQVTLTHGR
ncbi:hypothetical protein [Cellulomonas xiejunii]|uniref:hypothetical protein n=1 Tax=Cellulomonas xiejunii TaxID=2968083 RepID=UPI001D0E93AE|nr:hypothetical protein [Cellulomonas xiejunii]MCC2313533.1 hypothetical protein [Cellulomonas xiejunii]